ncbi:MAG TPA: DUF423 domain-containing protein [Cyclobacteriaceae bacterium]|jgi:uncharacterized membrane protein YgdD (TMEM256/DUF423 family)
MASKAIIIGSILGALAVAAGAFGAHALSEFLNESGRSVTYETAVKYQFYHSLLLILAGILGQKVSINIPVYLIVFGILVFSGSLYLLIFTNASWFGIIAPFGGASLIAGWLSLAYAARKLVN